MTNTHTSQMPNATISIHRLADLENSDAFIPGIETVFFAASGTQSFANEDARAAFRERWLGRFLTHDPQWVYVALETGADHPGQIAEVVGYLVGSIDDPAKAKRFSDLGYFQTFRTHTRTFPAQLHVNLAEHARGQGYGGRLIDAFVHDARHKGVTGVHVVTGAQSRNVSFYAREGFEEVARVDWNDNLIVFLGRHL